MALETIAQLSDVHFGRVVRPTYIRAAADLALSLRPDLIVLTGDYVSRSTHGEPEMIVAELGRLTAPAGVWGILGNHDHWHRAGVVAEALGRAGVRLLRNAGGWRAWS